MKTTSLDDRALLSMLQAGFDSLNEASEEINLLNVFPVPDGDTGTNMRITYEGGLTAAKGKSGVEGVLSSFATGSLFSARGNSGVLLSEYFKGFSLALQGKDEVCLADFALAMEKAYSNAYSATIVPTEGTILTVARDAANAVKENLTHFASFQDFFLFLIPMMAKSVDNTPNLLRCLAEAGVVDSGGKGLLCIYEGFADFFLGKRDGEVVSYASRRGHGEAAIDFTAFDENSPLDYGYCTEFLLQLGNAKIDVASFDLGDFTKKIGAMGDSLIVTKHDSVVKIHIHTKKPYEPMEFAQRYGEFLSIKIENMALQHNAVEKKKRRKKADVIVVANGKGIKKTFEELGSVRVIEGGDTMNASVGEILRSFEQNPAEEMIFMPNNKNIMMSAKTAIEQFKGGKVYLVPCTSIAECYLCLSMILMPGKEISETASEMEDFLISLHSGGIAKSSRDFSSNGISSSKEEYLELIDGEVAGSDSDRVEAFMGLLEKIDGIDSKEVLFAFYGDKVDEEEIETLRSRVGEVYPYLEIGFIFGGQKIYDYLVGYSE